MISTKKILMQIANSGKGIVLPREDLQNLQRHLIKMYRDLETVCEKHGIKICLAYGNVIGAMRHRGWIPWDDDLDVHMSRSDYDLFLSKYASEMPPQYKLSSYLSEGGSFARFAKVMDTSTVYVPITREKSEDTCIYIDIFPVDNVPYQPLLNKFRKGWIYFLMYTATSVMQAQIRSKGYKELMYNTKAGRLNWCFRQLWGRTFSFASYRTWNKWIEKFGKNVKHTGFVHIKESKDGCYRLIPEDYFFPFQKIELPEIGTVHVPNKPEKYLSLLYGDWQKIPEDEDKWHHYVSEMYIPEEK